MLNKNFNLHLTDLCNYRCKYCFVKKEKKFLSLDECKHIVDNISNYFVTNNISDGKINIAGGEPTTCRYLQDIIDYIVEKDIKVTLITNGSMLTESFIEKNRNKLYMIGLSVDSIKTSTNVLIGRCTYGKGKVLDYNQLRKICLCIKANGILLKINAVVSKLNLNEDILQLLEDVCPNRLKFLQMLPFDDFSKCISVSNAEFAEYLKKYQKFNYVPEYSADIAGSYMIFDSSGFVSTNNLHIDRQFSALQSPIGEIIKHIEFNYEGENKRYQI